MGLRVSRERSLSHSTSRRFVRHTGIAAPYLRADVQVEIIAPMIPGLHAHSSATNDPTFSRSATQSPSAIRCFDGIRYLPDGSEDPDFVLNQEIFRDASILLTGANFGIGSIREFAVLRLAECGFRSVIGPSFGPMFYRDCFAHGVLPLAVGAELVRRMADWVLAHPRVKMTVDLEFQRIERPGIPPIPFDVEPRLRSQLLLGVDELDEMLQHRLDAEVFRDENRSRLPWVYQNDGDGR